MKNQREKIVIRTSVIGICTNILLAVFKAVVGFLSNSIAIISDAVNNLSDALSSIITIVGTKLAGKAPDKKHPYGYGRVEYMTSFLISGIVLYAGITALVESIKKIITPEEVDYSIVTLLIITVGIVAKFVLGSYVKKKGHEVKSDSLVASGSDAFNDALLSIAVLVSAIIYLIFHVNIEAYISAILSAVIIKTGVELIRESVNNILGVRVESKLTKSIKAEVLKEESVQGAFDLVLNDYGPNNYIGSIHIEIPDTLTVAEVDKISRNITKRVLKKFGVLLHTIGVYSINTKDKEVIKTRRAVEDIVFSHKEILQMHGFYLDVEEKTLSFDIIIDFKADDREAIYQDIYDKVQSTFKEYKINITLDVDISD